MLALTAALGLVGAATGEAANPAPKSAAAKGGADEVAILETTKGRMVLEFWEKDAPQTVANFKKLARQGFYDGTGFHRIIKGFMIQGGDPKSKNPKAPDLGTGDPGYKIKDEFNAHKHVAGVISMANSGTANSAGSQFFIMDGDAPFLDGKYTAFGRVFEGMNVLRDIAATPVAPNAVMGGEKSKPLEWTTLKSVKVVPRSSLAKAAPSGGATKSGAAAKSAEGGAAKAAEPAAAASSEKKSGAAAEPAKDSGKEQSQGESSQETAPTEKAAGDSVQAPSE